MFNHRWMFLGLCFLFLVSFTAVTMTPALAQSSGSSGSGIDSSVSGDVALFKRFINLFGVFGATVKYVAYTIGTVFLLTGLVMLKQAYDRQGSVGTPVTLIIVAALLLSFGAIVDEANTVVSGAENSGGYQTIENDPTTK